MRNRVQELRKGKRMTQEDLAKQLGVTRQTIISIENGKYVASLALAIKISRVFSLAVEEIFELEDKD